MTHKDRIELYLSGNADKETEIQTETAMLADDGLMEEFIGASERTICNAPLDFAGSVMRMIGKKPSIPLLSRRMRAAVCFCSAAAIIIFTATGFDRRILEFMTNNFDRFNELLNSIKTF